jgi:predicted nucleic acid-binding protein
MALLIDTGVLLRAFDRADPDRAKIWLALRPTLRSSARPQTAMQNVAEFWNVSTRPATARGGMGHPSGRVALRVLAIERYCEVVTETENSYQIWRDLVASHGVIGASVHDARLVAMMLDRGISDILTLNAADFRRYPVNVITPDQVT